MASKQRNPGSGGRFRRLRSSLSQSESFNLFRLFRTKKKADEESAIGDSTEEEGTTQDEGTTQQATQDSTARRKIGWTILLAVLFSLQPLGLIGLGIYCYQTLSCAITVHVPHYHCKNGTSAIDHKTAMNVELAFITTEVLSRALLLAFCFKLEGWLGVKDIFCRLFFISDMWAQFVLTYLFCFGRFVIILLDEDDLGPHKQVAMATIILYIIDNFGILIVVGVLNYVTVKDLAANNTHIHCSRKCVWFLFKIVLICFWLQFFVYVITATFQFISGVVESSSASMAEMGKKLLKLSTTLGQFFFLKNISGCLWHKWCDDGKRIVGERSDELARP